MRLAKALVAMGEMELMSTTTLPLPIPSATPFLPNSTASTSGVSGTMVKMTSASRATAAALSTRTPPAAVTASGTWLRVCTNSWWPLLTRCRAMGVPMMPRPMNPTFIENP